MSRMISYRFGKAILEADTRKPGPAAHRNGLILSETPDRGGFGIGTVGYVVNVGRNENFTIRRK